MGTNMTTSPVYKVVDFDLYEDNEMEETRTTAAPTPNNRSGEINSIKSSTLNLALFTHNLKYFEVEAFLDYLKRYLMNYIYKNTEIIYSNEIEFRDISLTLNEILITSLDETNQIVWLRLTQNVEYETFDVNVIMAVSKVVEES